MADFSQELQNADALNVSCSDAIACGVWGKVTSPVGRPALVTKPREKTQRDKALLIEDVRLFMSLDENSVFNSRIRNVITVKGEEHNVRFGNK